jgi:hypothetical protein
MRHDVDDTGLLERGKADGGAAIIGEDQEGAAIRDDAAMQRHAVHRRRHAELADAVIDVAAGIIVAGERLLRLGLGVVGAGEIGRAAERFWKRGVDRLQREFDALRVATFCGLASSAWM